MMRIELKGFFLDYFGFESLNLRRKVSIENLKNQVLI